MFPIFRIEYKCIHTIDFPFTFTVEGTTNPTATASSASTFDDTSPLLAGEGVFDGIKADNMRFKTTGRNGFIVITLGQSQVIKKVRVYTDEVSKTLTKTSE